MIRPLKQLSEFVGGSHDLRRTRSRFWTEKIALSVTDPILTQRCFMMIGSDPKKNYDSHQYLVWQDAMDEENQSLQNNKT